MLLLAMSTPTNPIKAVLGLLQVAFARRYPERNIVIESVINAKNEFESCHSNKPLPDGIRFLSNYIILTQGLLRKGLESEAIGRKEKILFLKLLRRYYRMNNMNWSNIVGHYNRISYLILMSPFPYPLFCIYFRHLKAVSNIVNYLVK